MTTIERSERFQALHRGPDVLVLGPCWDGASARQLEAAGFPALATSSAAVAWALGWRDGESLPRRELVDAVARMCRVVCVPVSVDIVRGFGATPAEVAATVTELSRVGAVGINIEDGMGEPSLLAERIAAVRQLGLPLFVNARTDVYLHGVDPAVRFAETVRRLAVYVAAGADGVFVPGLADLGEIARLVRAVDRPVNVYAGPGVPSVPELARAGVRRVTAGCGPMQATMALTRRIAQELRTTGTYTAMTADALPYGEANGLFPE
jgi:2-methylisocitrate lyase-like PEP mutase family enzyme